MGGVAETREEHGVGSRERLDLADAWLGVRECQRGADGSGEVTGLDHRR
jgi:hypothetical protein